MIALTYKQIAQKVNLRVKLVDHCIYNAKRAIRGISSKTERGRFSKLKSGASGWADLPFFVPALKIGEIL